MLKIVLVGQDIRLLETRAEVLRKTGADVVYCVGCQALNIVASEMPNLLVLCHSIVPEEAEAIADRVRTHYPKTRVLLVLSPMTAEGPYPYQDAKFDAKSLAEPAQLVERATELLQALPFHHVREITHDRQEPATP
jgi:hypothetical protein